jgi:replicative DNA helicase
MPDGQPQQPVKSPINDMRVPPQSNEAEQAVLGSIMLRPETVNDILEVIDPESFYADKHEKIYAVVLELFSNSEGIDLVTVAERLEEKDQLSDVGGRSFLTEIVNSVPSAANIQHYAEIVRKKYMMRQLIEAANEINQIGYDDSVDDLEIILDEAEKKIFEVTSEGHANSYVKLGDELTEAFERLEEINESSDEMRGVPTGFPTLDNKLSGLQPSDMVILAARPSMGKTSLALDIARQAATQHNQGVCLFSLEMSSQQLVDRMLAAEARVDSWKLRTGKVRKESEFEQLRDAMNMLSEAPIFIDDQPGNNIIKMRSVARRLKREHDLGLIIVDYLQLMQPTGRAKNSDSMVFQVTEISRSIKGLARELNVPVLCLSQLSRAVEQRGGEPRLSDLRDSGSIEQDADVVMFIHREDRYEEEEERDNIADIIIAKHRNGPTGRTELYFDQPKTSFLSIEDDEFDMPTDNGIEEF